MLSEKQIKAKRTTGCYSSGRVLAYQYQALSSTVSSANEKK
jgi:hypothetical protein